MTTKPSALDQMRELTAVQSTDALLLSFHTLHIQEDRGEAERLAMSIIGGELTKRARVDASKAGTESLVDSLQKFIRGGEYKDLTILQQMDYRVVSAELENRFPEATEIVDAWMDSLTSEQMDAAGCWDWDREFCKAAGITV